MSIKYGDFKTVIELTGPGGTPKFTNTTFLEETAQSLLNVVGHAGHFTELEEGEVFVITIQKNKKV